MQVQKINEPVNVLLVDDKKENLFALEKLLEDKSGNVNFIKAASGYEALKIAVEKEIGLVLLDVQMPEMDGYEVARLLKENDKTKNTPIIFVTALTQEPSYVLEGYEKGAVDYLFKPLNPSITRAKVQAFIKIYLQQKELEQKNKDLESLGTLVNTTQDLMCILDARDLSFLNNNQAWQTVLHYEQEDIRGSLTDFLHEGNKRIQGVLINAIKDKTESANFETRLKNKKGEYIFYSWNMVYKKGKWYGTARDISMRKQAEAALSQAYEELEHKVKERTRELQQTNETLQNEIERRYVAEKNLKIYNEMLVKTNADLDTFVNTASHDLKLPVANLEGLIETLSDIDYTDKEEYTKIVSMLNRSVRQLKETIHELIKTIKKEKENLEEIQEVDCETLLAEIMMSIQDLIEEAQAQIHSDFKKCKVIRIAKTGLKSIIYNLLTNAIKYRAPQRKPEIYINTLTEGDYDILLIRDNGLGIKPEDQKRLFSMFERIHNHVEGSGMGLYLVKQAIEKSGGRIEVESEIDRGTGFKLYFKRGQL